MKHSAIAIALIFSLLNFGAGCTDESPEVVGVDNPSNSVHEISDAVTIIECNSGFPVAVTDATFSLYGDDVEHNFQGALDNGEVRATIAKFEALGYEVDLGNSSFVQGTGCPEGTADSIDVEITNLVMRYVPDSTQGFIWISHQLSPDHLEIPASIATAVCSFARPATDTARYEYVHFGSGPDGIERGMWIKFYISPFDSKGSTGFAANAWKDWALCVIISTAVGCALCGAGCSLTGPAWVACTVTCCGLVALGAMIACAIYMLVN